eukprot:scaffold15321_cov83-Skeletonema_dohrnii-CCMP3373.AAC.2
MVAVYDDKIAMVEEENKRLRKDDKRLLENVEERDEKMTAEEERKMLCEDLEQRDRRIAQHEYENNSKRLSGMVESASAGMPWMIESVSR